MIFEDGDAMEFSHKPVLLQQTIEALAIRPEGIYVDGTAGGGGHSAAILERLSGGRLICVDQDPDAIAVLQERFAGKTPSEVRNEALLVAVPKDYPIPENKRIQKYKAKWAA